MFAFAITLTTSEFYRRHVIERVWHDIHPDQELRQEPGRAPSAAVMGFFRSKQVPTGGIGSVDDALSPDSIEAENQPVAENADNGVAVEDGTHPVLANDLS